MAKKTMTHQEIVDARDTIYKRARIASEKERKWMEAERERLTVACAKIGHVWGRPDFQIASPLPQCRICGAWSTEPK